MNQMEVKSFFDQKIWDGKGHEVISKYIYKMCVQGFILKKVLSKAISNITLDE